MTYARVRIAIGGQDLEIEAPTNSLIEVFHAMPRWRAGIRNAVNRAGREVLEQPSITISDLAAIDPSAFTEPLPPPPGCVSGDLID